MKSVRINVRLDFPPEVDLSGLEEKEYGINHLHDFHEIFSHYCKINRRNGYFPLKEEGYRWMFFLDTYETYSPKETEDLHMDPVFLQKWYRCKYMTVVFIDNNFEVFTRTLPATQQEYEEEKQLFDKLYKIFRENQDFIGRYVKRNKRDDFI